MQTNNALISKLFCHPLKVPYFPLLTVPTLRPLASSAVLPGFPIFLFEHFTYVFCSQVVCFFKTKTSLCSPICPWTLHLPASASQGRQLCATKCNWECPFDSLASFAYGNRFKDLPGYSVSEVGSLIDELMMISAQQIFTERPSTCHRNPARIIAFAGGLQVEKKQKEKGGREGRKRRNELCKI